MSLVENELEVRFPENLLFLINEPARYKVLWGGRGGSKTETVAEALIILVEQMKLRILCVREIQNSIEESVYETIKNRIIDMGLERDFDVQSTKIVCKRTGGEFIFSGLRYKINSIKSMARIDICWVEEATNVSRTSWLKLPPSIRGRHENDPNGMGGPFKLGPEIWVTFNPELDTDETYKRFILKRDQYAPEYILENGKKVRYSFVEKLNHSDNPFLPNDMLRDIEIAKAGDQDEYMHVWEGNTKQTIEGSIYAKEIRKTLLDHRRGKVPYDVSRPVQTFWDLGHNDHTAIWFVQQVGMEYNIINYIQDRLQKVPYYIELLQSFQYNYKFHHLPHDANNETLASRSVFKMLLDAYPDKVKMVPRVPTKIVGIRAARVVFDLCNFDEENTADGWQALCRYQFKIDKNGTFSKEPLHNEYSNGADAFQTFALTLKTETASKKPPKTVTSGKILNMSRPGNSWMGNL